MVNEYLSHLVDRNYSSKTVHAYGYDLLAYCRWLSTEDIAITAVTTDVLLAFLKAVRKTRGSPKSNLAHCTRSSRHPSQTPRRTTPPPQNPERIALNGKQLRAAHISQKSLRQRPHGNDHRPVQDRMRRHHRLPQRPLQTLDDVEYTVVGWVDWYNNRRLHGTLASRIRASPLRCLNRRPQPA